MIVLFDYSCQHLESSFYQKSIFNFKIALVFQVGKFIEVLAPSATGFLVVSMTLDRYFAIVKPLSFYLSRNYVHKQSTLSWVAACIISIPQLVHGHVDTASQTCDVSSSWVTSWMFKVYLTLIILLIFVLPMTLCSYCYTKVILKLTQKAASCVETNANNQSLVNSQKRLLAARRKATKMTIFVIACYFICWAPYFIMAFLHCWFKVDQPYIWVVVQFLIYFNSICNPVIYGLFSIKRNDTQTGGVCWQRTRTRFAKQPALTEQTGGHAVKALGESQSGPVLYRLRARWTQSKSLSGSGKDTNISISKSVA